MKKLALHTLDLYRKEEFDVLVTSCGTCTATVKEIWPEMLTDLSREDRALLEGIVKKTFDISELLVGKLGVKEQAKPKAGELKVTSHDPCHLKKSLGVFKEPRQLIGATVGYQLVEMAGADTCCGMGGSFNVQYYDISRSVGLKKRNAIAETECDVVATGCPACMMQISDMLSQQGDSIPVKHFVELYAESIS